MWEVLIDSWNGSAASSWLKLWFYLTVYSLIFILLATDCLFTWRTFSVPRWWCGWSELASYWSKREGTTCSSKCYKPPAGLLAHISCTQKKPTSFHVSRKAAQCLLLCLQCWQSGSPGRIFHKCSYVSHVPTWDTAHGKGLEAKPAERDWTSHLPITCKWVAVKSLRPPTVIMRRNSYDAFVQSIKPQFVI